MNIFYLFKTQKQRFPIYKNRRCIFAGKKAPAGAPLVAPSLDNTDSVYVIHKNTDSVYVIQRNADSVYVIHRNLYF